MAWLILVVAGLFEVCWSTGLKASDGFKLFWPSVFTIVTLALSMLLLGYSMRTLPLGTAYTVWTGIGAIGAVIAGIVMFHEPVNAVRIGCILLILGGIIGLKLTEPL
ncbi:Quaternary ammonium compound-resistance protein SugE [Anatilimnocola aggregata]|uniref:Guanidinium exporter n=1 Tax=Anatilimnocola aggregata TaxID=2528021 RepID=A0A517Y5C1_9BACT|nr:multidrug efflux SMR transporter [Anatilimnocola aggregata]QDU25441.1 Quaternary ammonium compound-resistance protein SugE [Anatilimnocola aggregata]